MKKLLFLIFGFIFCFFAGAQQPFRLLVEPGRTILSGDGEDFTTLVITARNSDGEVITSMNGRVKIGVSSGFPDEPEVTMQSGVALVKFTSPMFGTPVKSSQRMVYFMFRFMQKFVIRSSGSTDYTANQRLATDIALETFREGLNPITLIPKKNGDNFVYIVCEMNGVKGRAKIEITKATDGRNGNIIPGVYYGKDITGQSDWYLDITRGGEGVFSESTSSGEATGVLFTNENFTEFNDAMGKMAGMTGFMKAYIGLPASETKYVENYNIKEMGMSSAYMPMPNNGVFLYIPPILFEYAGQKKNDQGGNTASEEEIRTEKTGIVLSQNQIIGDGRSRTKAVFHYEDENGVPVSGKQVNWEMHRDIKVISSQNVTDAKGNAVAILEAPLIKATGETRGENTGEIIDNSQLYRIKVTYSSLARENDYTEATLCVYKVIEKEFFVLKPGIEPAPVKLLLPQLEHFILEGSIFSMVQQYNSTSSSEKTALNDAVVMIPRKRFDKERFQKTLDLFLRKDRKMFLIMMDGKDGGFCAVTDKNGRFKISVGGEKEKKLTIQPVEAKISDLTGHRAGSLSEALANFTDPSFINRVNTELYNMEKLICTGNSDEAWHVEEKLHIIGVLMTNIKGTSRYMRDCAKMFGEQSYEAMKFLLFFAAEKYKFNQKLGQWIGSTDKGKKLKDAGLKLENYLVNDLGGQNAQNGISTLIKRFLFNNLSEKKVLASQEYYKLLGHAANYVLTEKQKQMMDAVVNAVVYYLPFPDKISDLLIAEYYKGQQEEILKLLNHSPAQVHVVYNQIHPVLRDRSTDIRQQYIEVAAWRLKLDMFKAYTDLFADLVVKGAVVLYDAKTLNYANIQKHMEYIDNAKNVLNAAYHSASVANEFLSYRNLWAESDAILIYANKCISQGTISPVAEEGRTGFSLFPEALAAENSFIEPIKGIPAISTGQLKIRNGQLPVTELNDFFEGYKELGNWLNSNDDNLMRLSVESPETALELFKAENDYSKNLQNIAILSAGLAEKPDDMNLQQLWNKSAEELVTASGKILKTSAEAVEKIKQYPDDPKVDLPDATQSIELGVKKYSNSLIIFIAGGSIILLLILFFIIRRRRKKNKAKEPGASVDKQTPLKLQEQSSQSSAATATPKYCPSCGNALKPGARFCGKCGYKMQ